MRWNRITTATAVSAAVALSVVACGGNNDNGSSGSGGGGNSTTAEYNAAVTGTYNPSDKKGGTLRMAI
ncbi:MAG TPA: ABC transporter substrate-binding protein, partial [Kribbella sp.]|nr:ABC transporter substrate-binding protein [Kribbella sp.]